MNPCQKLLAAASVALAAIPSLALAQQQVYAYPAHGQSEKKQASDHQACHEWAVNQSGYNPGYTPAPPPKTGGLVRGAAGGAAIGALGGAIGGDAGRGAAIGAGAGALIGGIRQNRQNRAAAAQQQAEVDSYNKALATCFRGRGYTVN
ncbi:MAG: glycine zipper domain-containing protein [Caulobacteraceae bacterium]